MTVRVYLAPRIGRVPLAKLAPEHIQRMMADLTAAGLSNTTVGYARTVLRIALGRALKDGRVDRNVATLVDPPARHRQERSPLTTAEVGDSSTA
jgi:site-specific recombinase XerC